MKICLLCSSKKMPLSKPRGFLLGLLSYVIHNDTLSAEKLMPKNHADILVISAEQITAATNSAICNEATRMGSHGVFLDTSKQIPSEIPDFLQKHGLLVFSPLKNDLPPNTRPVIEAMLSGGCLEDYIIDIAEHFPDFAVSVRHAAYELLLPSDGTSPREMSFRELSSLISRHSPDIFFSPHLYCKYFMYEDKSGTKLILFDDYESLSRKLRLAKKHGASHAFLVYDEISDILDKIFF